MKKRFSLLCLFFFCVGVHADTTLHYPISQSSDDAVERLADGTVRLYEQNLDLGEEIIGGGAQMAGLRFPGIQLPRGVQIVEAYVQFTAMQRKDAEFARLVISAEAAADSATFTETPHNLSTRPLSQSQVVWADIPPWTAPTEKGLHQRTPDLAPLLQEIVNLEAWRSGDALTLLFSGVGTRQAASFDSLMSQDMAGFAPELVLVVRPERRYGITDGGNDVVEYLDGTVVSSRTSMDLNGTLGLRFPEIVVPQGSQVLDAYIQFTSAASVAEDALLSVQITGVDSDDAPLFGQTKFGVTSQVRTKAKISWNEKLGWQAGAQVRTPSLVTLVQEILNRDRWRAGGAMAFVLEGAGLHSVVSFEGQTQAEPTGAGPELVILLGQRGLYSTQEDTDDMEEYESGELDFDSSDLEMFLEERPARVEQLVGIRFPNVGIPRGAYIVDAYIQFTCDEPQNSEDPFAMIIAGIAEDNAATFSLDDYAVSSRPLTQTTVLWSDIPLWTRMSERGPNQRTPNLAAIIQEITGRAGWQAFNGLGFVIQGIEGSRSAVSHEGSLEGGNPSYYAPLLNITYMVDGVE